MNLNRGKMFTSVSPTQSPWARLATSTGAKRGVPCMSSFFSRRSRHTILVSDWSSDVCSSDLLFWVVVPLLAGAVSVAEERKLGTMEAQLCMPISSRLQFAIKLLFVVVLGGVLSAALAWVAEDRKSVV